MIPRYCRPKMKAIWELENKFQKWLEVEKAVAKAWYKLGQIPKSAYEEIRDKVRFKVERIHEIEKETHHDMIAFITSVRESLSKEAARYFHFGVTSYDIEDPAFSLLLKEAAYIIIDDILVLRSAIAERAREFKNVLMIGRTHGVHAEPITFGFKLANWYDLMNRSLERMRRARDIISYGKVSGAVGIYATIDPEVEKLVCGELELKVADVSTQIISRDRHAEYLSALALTASCIEQIATQIRLGQQTERQEIQEPFGKKQKGSSAMPHKKNPIVSERLCGQARIIRANLVAAMESIVSWDERDISQSSVERVIFPDSLLLLDYMLDKLTSLINGLVVNPQKMDKNLEMTGGVIASQMVRDLLIDKGMPAEQAYELVQRCAFTAFEKGMHLADILAEEPGVLKQNKGIITKEELEVCFDWRLYIRHIQIIFNRFAI